MTEENSQKLKKICEEAVGIVKELPEVFQPKAFEIVVKLLLEETEKEALRGGKVKIKPSEEGNREEKLDILAQELQVSDKKILQTVYSFPEKGPITLTARLEGKNSEVQRQIAYLYLLVKSICEKEEWVSALELSKQIVRYGVDDGHVALSLEKERGKILGSGSKKGKKYGLSPVGIQGAKVILRNLLSI